MTKQKKGFTIVEISLAMIFISILLVSIATVTIRIGSIYKKGLTIRSVNSAGQELIDEFSRAITNSPTKNNENTMVSAMQQIPGIGNVMMHGAFCTGRYSYLWNTGYSLNDDKYPVNGSRKQAKIKYKINESSDKQLKKYRLLRIRDDGRKACGNTPSDGIYTYNVSTLTEEPIEILTDSEERLVLYDLVFFGPFQHNLTLQSFYSGTFILGTMDSGVDILATGDYCKDKPSDLSTDFNYCMINKFNFAIRATGDLTDAEREEQQK